MKKLLKNPSSWLWLTIVFYFVTHLKGLALLPVFADEAIYIRWAQLIIDDWQQYLFFPLNDGKTPLFIWLLSLGQKVSFLGVLHVSRLLSVIIGALQVIVGVKIIQTLKGEKTAQIIGALSFTFLPFWFFYHRMALMDGLLVLWLSVSWWLLMSLKNKKGDMKQMVFSGLAFGMALWTKLPALLFIPALGFAPLLLGFKKKDFALKTSWAAGSVLIGLVVFLLLKIHPAFGQLFNRGNDFLYPIHELLETGVFNVLWRNTKLAISVLGNYLTWPVLLLPFAGFFQPQRRRHGLLMLSALGFMGAILLLGKTVHPRYLLPAALPLTVSAALVLERFSLHTQKLLKRPLSMLIRSAALVVMLTIIASSVTQFVLISWQNPDYLPLIPQDKEQYLTEWSSGHGIEEVTSLIISTSVNQTIAVATEGYFGTLPDGILMYLHRQNVQNIMVEGIGQPVISISGEFIEKAEG